MPPDRGNNDCMRDERGEEDGGGDDDDTTDDDNDNSLVRGVPRCLSCAPAKADACIDLSSISRRVTFSLAETSLDIASFTSYVCGISFDTLRDRCVGQPSPRSGNPLSSPVLFQSSSRSSSR